MALLQRVRDSGRCVPSLLSQDRVVNEDGFETAVTNLLDMSHPNGLALGSEAHIASDFEAVLQMAANLDKVPGDYDLERRKIVLEYRRCILLAILGSTPATNAPLKLLLSNGLLVVIKSWLDDILSGSVGGVDLLLHLLTNIIGLPVTKSSVVSSGLGKAVGATEKHKICVGTMNESAIRTRVQAVKDAWSSSVKANKDPNESVKSSSKRSLESAEDQSPMKKVRPEDSAKKSSTFSNLLSKVSTAAGNKPLSVPNVGINGMNGGVKIESNSSTGAADAAALQKKVSPPKKSTKRVKWADHFGGNLQAAREIQADGADNGAADVDQGGVSWSDRKKRDRLREKELLANAKRSKLVDDDEDLITTATSKMRAMTPWHQPKMLPERSDITKAQCDSHELTAQNVRQAKVSPVRYLSEDDVPNNPSPMSDVEQALDVASQASAVIAKIPFFVSQQPVAPPPAIAPAPTISIPPPVPMSASMLPPPPHHSMLPPPMNALPIGATAEMVQAMGLPLFLVGSNIQALQTLANTPSLLSTFVDAHGMYDQPRLMSLVQTLSQNMVLSQPAHQSGYQHTPTASTHHATPYAMQQQSPYHSTVTHSSSYGSSAYGPASALSSYAPAPAISQYGPASTISAYGPASTTTFSYGQAAPRQSYRAEPKSDAGNLHLSGYGPSTTQSDIIALFAPYVRVDEVVMKSNFSFVNTSDPDGAARAREALSGALLGGSPIRINLAQRRSRDSDSLMSSVYGNPAPKPTIWTEAIPLPINGVGQIDYDSVRDDRGNPATKNLFVAGYGAGTTEQQIRDTFSLHAVVTGCVMKGTFCFVNTADRIAAVHAREALMGQVLNGGVLRINFAKETGRLGTSFDTTYGPSTSTQSRYMRNPVH